MTDTTISPPAGRRFHVHMGVTEIAPSVRFYSALFGAPPTVEHADYAKWMLDDPRVNFAISTRAAATGVDHLGLQLESDAELGELQTQVAAAELAAVQEQGVACCYARSNKYWLEDPQGVAWEAFNSLDSIPTFNEATESSDDNAAPSACCAPPAAAKPPAVSGCCG